MTEEEWLSGSDFRAMLNYATDRAGDWNEATERRLRLVACACCRVIWDLMPDERCRTPVELAERSADEFVSRRTLDLFSGDAEEAFEEAVRDNKATEVAQAALAASHASNPNIWVEDVVQVIEAVTSIRGDGPSVPLLRDIFGNPFRPVAVDSRWLTADVVALARGIYGERAFDRLPILADAIQDAGCGSAELLAHCRDPRLTHVRGCWAVDLVLGKS